MLSFSCMDTTAASSPSKPSVQDASMKLAAAKEISQPYKQQFY